MLPRFCLAAFEMTRQVLKASLRMDGDCTTLPWRVYFGVGLLYYKPSMKGMTREFVILEASGKSGILLNALHTWRSCISQCTWISARTCSCDGAASKS